MKKLSILAVILFFTTALVFAKNDFGTNNTWLLDTGNEDYRMIYKGTVDKDITVDNAEHTPDDVISAGTINYKNMTITSNGLITFKKSNSGYTFLNSIKNPALIPLDNELKNADLIEIQPVSGDFTIVIPGKEYKKIKVFKISKSRTAVQYYNMTFLFSNDGYTIKAAAGEDQ